MATGKALTQREGANCDNCPFPSTLVATGPGTEGWKKQPEGNVLLNNLSL